MKNTGLNRFYATTFDNYVQEALDAYDYVNGALKQVEGAMMIGHRSEGDLRIVNYDNGVTIYINYGDEDAVTDGIVIPAKDYRTEGDR